mmetsp:Transcript_3256/g.6807  ORF Transcript_3256/g.6807 Transcript_3256/m.6807 type:complete len:703 (+) Transcript_3256:221-2329(+)
MATVSTSSPASASASIIASSSADTAVEQEPLAADRAVNNRAGERIAPSSEDRLFAAASAYVPRPRLVHNSSLTLQEQQQQQNARRSVASSVQQAPVILRKKAASVASRLSSLATQGRRFVNSSGSRSSSRTSRTNSERSSRSTSTAASANGQPSPSALATSHSTASSAQQQPPSATNMSAPPRYKALDSPGKAWGTSWRRFRTATPSPTRCTTLSPSFSTTTGNESTDFYLSDSDSERAVLFDSMSLLAPSAANIDELAAMTKAHQQQRQPQNVLQWLDTTCPTDVIPHILAYCGPQTTSRLSHVNKFWFRTLEQDSTWRVLCQDLYKWKPGDEEPSSWKEFYIQNPCVPVDYKSIHSVLKAHPDQNVSIWLRPGRYYLKETLKIGRSPQQKLSIATMKLPSNIFPSPLDICETPGGMEMPKQRNKRKSPAFLKFIMCTAAAYHEGAVDDESLCSEMSELDNNSSPLVMPIPQRPTRATLVMRTRKQNEPVINVSTGQFSATNLNIEHAANGTDIWHGNAAIHIQPEQNEDGPPPLLRRDLLPVAHLSGLRVTSRTGRGIVTIDGGQLHCQRTRVYDCAATGIYIGGRGTRARVQQTDVLRNGLGSRGTSRRNAGISRGHSGVYLEQGVADIIDCNVSNNTLTGITAVSNENSTLNLSDSDLLGNGSFQLEIPAEISRGVNMRQNRLDGQGTGRIRAALAPH